MSHRLAKWIECEFDRNAWFFGEFKGGLMASCDFIDYVLKDKDLFNLDEEDQKYIKTIRSCYSKMKNLSNEMIKSIEEYKKAYTELFADEEFVKNKKKYKARKIKKVHHTDAPSS